VQLPCTGRPTYSTFADYGTGTDTCPGSTTVMLCTTAFQATASRSCSEYRTTHRIVLEAPRRSHVSPLLRTLHWLPIQQRIYYKLPLLTFKVRSTSTPSYMRLLIQDREHGHNLRSTTTALRQPFTTTTFAKRAFRCSAPAGWNSLPKTVLNSDSLAVFKFRLKTFLFSQAFPSFSAH